MKYSLFDAHCDTILKVYESFGNLYDNNFDVSIKKLQNFDMATQVFAIFNIGDFDTSQILKIGDLLKNKLENCEFVTNTKNLKKTNAMLSIEGLGNTKKLVEDDILKFYDIGIRIMSLTWNMDNVLCGGIVNNNLGLSDFGKKILKIMQGKNMILDVSHISDKGFYDSLNNFSGKIVATHSNSRKICQHNRNLTDEMFLEIKKRDGVVGINLYPLFINNSKVAFAKDVIKHIEHFMALGGENNIGIGADFDGIDFTMSDITDVSKMNILFDELAKLNYSDDTIAKISHKNYEKLLKSV